MRAGLVVVLLIQFKQVAKVPLSKYHDIVYAFPPDRANQPFGISVLPCDRAAVGRLAEVIPRTALA